MKHFYLKSLLVIALLLGGVNYSWGDATVTVGETDNTSTWWTAFSDYYTIDPNHTLTLNFNNYSSKAQNWHNWVVVVTTDAERNGEGYSEYFVLRADNYGWGDSYDSRTLLTNNYNWDTFLDDMDNSSVSMTILRKGNIVIVRADITTDDETPQQYYEQFVTTCGDGSQNIRVFLTVEAAHLTNLSSSDRETIHYDYSVKAKDGTGSVLKTITSGTWWEDDAAITIAYPQYIMQGSTLYNIANNSSGDYYRTTFTPNAENFEKILTYNGSTISDVYNYWEAEDVGSIKQATNDARASHGKMGYTNNNSTYVYVETLPAGTYQFFARPVWSNNANGTCNFKVGNDVKFTMDMSKSVYTIQNSESFTIGESQKLYIACDGSSTSGLDWFYIKGTPTYKVIGATDNSTYYLADMTDKVTLTPGQSWHYRFVNHNNGGSSNWLNWVLPVYNSADSRVITLRSDFWEDVKGANTGCSATIVWDDFVNQMNGSTIDMTVDYSTSCVLNISSVITTSDGSEWTYSYNSSNAKVDLSGNIKVALSVSSSWLELIEEGPSVPISTLGWSTLYSPYALDFSDVSGLTAYTASVSDNTVTLTEVSDVPANTGVVLHGTASTTYNIPITSSSSTAQGELTGNAAASTAYDAATGHTYYVLAASADANYKVQFRPVTSGSIAAGKAFLDITDASVKAFNVVFDLETGINTKDNGLLTNNNCSIYNLTGQRMNKLQKGINIVNGKKYIIK